MLIPGEGIRPHRSSHQHQQQQQDLGPVLANCQRQLLEYISHKNHHHQTTPTYAITNQASKQASKQAVVSSIMRVNKNSFSRSDSNSNVSQMAEALTSAMNAFPYEERVQYSCLKVIRHILPHSYNKNNNNQDSYKPLIEQENARDLSTSDTDSSSSTESGVLPNNDDDHEDNKLDLESTVHLVLQAMKGCPKSAKIQFLAVSLLTELVSNHNQQEQEQQYEQKNAAKVNLCQVIIQGGGLIRLSETITYHCGFPKLARIACQLHQTLACNAFFPPPLPQDNNYNSSDNNNKSPLLSTSHVRSSSLSSSITCLSPSTTSSSSSSSPSPCDIDWVLPPYLNGKHSNQQVDENLEKEEHKQEQQDEYSIGNTNSSRNRRSRKQTRFVDSDDSLRVKSPFQSPLSLRFDATGDNDDDDSAER